MNISEDMLAILEAARWAPSGDNMQPWRFKVIDDQTIYIIRMNNAENVLNSFSNHEPDFIALGCLLENIRLAAAAQNKTATWEYQGTIAQLDHIKVHFEKTEEDLDFSLLSYVKTRSVNRRPYKIKRLTAPDKEALNKALGLQLKIYWFEDFSPKLKLSLLLMSALKQRMQMKLTQELLTKAIDTKQRLSPHKIPIATLPLDPLSMMFNKFILADIRRIKVAALIPGALVFPQIQVELLPGIQCAAHFIVEWKGKRPEKPKTVIEAGQHIQRFWLEATRRGIAVQPTYAFPLFYHGGKFNPEYFADNQKQINKLKKFAREFEKFYGANSEHVFFTGRIGYPKHNNTKARSTRRPIEDLLIEGTPKAI